MNLNEIKEALSKATPGPWSEWARGEIVSINEKLGHEHVAWCSQNEIAYRLQADAHLIANAPEWLASLVEQVEEMEHRCKSYELSTGEAWKLYRIIDKVNSEYLQQIKQYERQVEEMQKTLEWYADNTNYHPYRFMGENGGRARQTLQSLKGDSHDRP